MALVAIVAFLVGAATFAVIQQRRRRESPLSRSGAFGDDHALRAIDQLFESTPNGIGLGDRELRFRRVNHALAGRSWWSRTSPR